MLFSLDMKHFRLFVLSALASLALLPMQAQDVITVQAGDTLSIPAGMEEDERLVQPELSFFVPHWYLSLQGGGAYDVGEASFSQLLSPSLQVALGYSFSKFLSARLSVSGLWARNRYVYPQLKYSWQFIQPTLEMVFYPAPLFKGYDYDNFFNPYVFAGFGAAFSFGNEDAVEGNKQFGITFSKLWNDVRLNPALRMGLGSEFRLTDNLSLTVEANANMLPDHFNSKKGRNNNRDWHFNALVGVKFTLGKSHGKTEAVYEKISRPITQQVVIAKPEVKTEEEILRFKVNIQFIINRSDLRRNQMAKLNNLLRYLQEHPNAYVRLSGYADRETGNAQINMRLSRERSQAVSQWLQDQGISESRIRRYAKGDTVQPFDLPEDNRVTTCYVYNPDEESGEWKLDN